MDKVGLLSAHQLDVCSYTELQNSLQVVHSDKMHIDNLSSDKAARLAGQLESLQSLFDAVCIGVDRSMVSLVQLVYNPYQRS